MTVKSAGAKTRKTPEATVGARHVVEFMGRKIEVKAPTPETLARWGRDIQVFNSDTQAGSEDLAIYADLIDRMWDGIYGIVANDEDVDWLREGVRKNDISLTNAHVLMTQANQSSENRAARRAR